MNTRILRQLLILGAFGLIACASNPYAGISLEPGAADPVLQDEVRRSIAGDKRAQMALGIRYENREGVSINCKKAMQFYKMAASDKQKKVWIYSPPVSKNDHAKIISIETGLKQLGVAEAKYKLEMKKCE